MNGFHDQSRVWIYMSNRAFTDVESSDINLALQHFVKLWTAHGSNLKAHGEVVNSRFILLMVDETEAGASGCSIDKSVHFIKAIEKEYGIELFNRLLFAWEEGEEIKTNHLSELQSLFNSGALDENTIIYNNLVSTKKELDEKWRLPLKSSWMMTRLRKEEV